MSVLFNLSSKQLPVFKKTMKAAKVKSLQYDTGGVHVNADNYNKIADVLNDAWFKSLVDGSPTADESEVLRVIVSRLSAYEQEFDATAFEKIKEGLEDAIAYADGDESKGVENILEKTPLWDDYSDDLSKDEILLAQKLFDQPLEENNDNA